MTFASSIRQDVLRHVGIERHAMWGNEPFTVVNDLVGCPELEWN